MNNAYLKPILNIFFDEIHTSITIFYVLTLDSVIFDRNILEPIQSY